MLKLPPRPPKLPTPRLVRVLERVRTGLQKVHRHTTPPPIAMLELITAGWLSQAICVAAKLGVADALADGPRSAAELAAQVGADADALHRLLRALAQHDVFSMLPDGRFAQSALSETLRRESPAGSVRGFALYHGSPQHREHWSLLDRVIQTGRPIIEAVRGKPFFAYVQSDPEFGATFNDAMSSVSDLAKDTVSSSYDFGRYGCIVDVGGGHGRLLASILAKHPGTRGVLFDLPEVVAGASPVLAHYGVAARCIIESGSFFERVPTGGDAYLLKHIVHDWSDDEAARILACVRAAIPQTGRLLLVESVLSDDATPHPAKLFDLEMLLCVGGRERTQRAFGALLARAGFRLAHVFETPSPLAIIEAVPC